MNKKKPITKPAGKKNSAAPRNCVIKKTISINENITEAPKTPGCNKKCIYRMMEDNPELKDLISKVREMIVTEAEKSLLKSVQNGNVTSIIFALKTLGRSKGYVINGYKPHELAAKINQKVLKKLSDDQLAELEKLLEQKKDLTTFIREIGLDAPSD